MIVKLLAPILALGVVAQSAGYRAEIEAFRKQRAADISSDTGWAALTDLRWLDRGQFTIGRGPGNAIVLNAPSSPERLGTLEVTAAGVTLHVVSGVRAVVNGQPVTDVALKPDVPARDAVTIGDLTLGVIERASRLALRVWDRMSPDRVHFHGLQWFPVDERWRINATFVPHQPAPVLRIQNIVGQTVEMPNPGAAVFTMNGREYRLEALLEEPGDHELFFMFRDATSNKTTYGAGRYLYSALPTNGHVTLDFNRAYNPPCAFTKFATCPLPPASNRLSLAVDAGERDYRH